MASFAENTEKAPVEAPITHLGDEEPKVESKSTEGAAPPHRETTGASKRTTGASKRACRFFAKGNCRSGESCNFSHDPSVVFENGPAAAGPPTNFRQAPPPVMIMTPPGAPIFSIDVECVATSVQHTGRSVAQVAMVNEWCQPQFNVLIKQDKPVLSYITPLTGLTKEMIDQHGQPLADALAVLRSHLSPNAVLVGQNILKDVQWLQLAEGVDYGALIDLAALFRCWNPVRGEYTGFSQDHCAKAWLGVGDRPNHDALSDSVISMSLFNAYRSVQMNPEQLFQLQQATMNTPRVPGFSATHPTVDGCCMGNRKSCTCGAPNFY